MSGSDADADPAENPLRAIQSEDYTEVDTTVDNLISDLREQEELEANLNVEAEVRELLHSIKDLLATDRQQASERLEVAHHLIRNDEDLDRILDPRDELLASSGDLTEEEAQRIRGRFRRQKRLRDRRDRHPTPKREYKTLLKIARALGYFESVTDMTPFVPVTLEPLSGKGSPSVEDPRPIGRRRLPKGTTQTQERASVEINHQSCEHIAAIALPRKGKDSTLVSIGKNLKEEHGYTYISIFDDGRMETPMMPIPNDDPDIQQNLEQLGQEADAMDGTVYIPAIEGMPDILPSNFQPFTFGIDSLTPKLLLRLAGVNKSDSSLEGRVREALESAIENSGEVPELVTRLQALAEKQTATIEWEETHEKQSGGQVETYTADYQMDAEKALKDAAERIAKLAGDGLLASADADTNIDMKAIVEDNDTAAILCCAFLPQGMEELKYTIIDVWLRRIHWVRDEYPRTPRVVLEARELKGLAPSKMGDVWYKQQIRSLKQTFVFLSSQGGSRRILLLGSTQKWRDVAKSVRSNFGIYILLSLSPDEIDTLDEIHHFSDREHEYLSGLPPGMGMVIAHGEKYYPVQFRGAPCGLGLGDRHWLDRYGEARGARVLGKYETWASSYADEDWWVHVPEAEAYDADIEVPTKGDYYNPWFLVASDFPEDTTMDDVDEALVERVLEERRDHELKTDISLQENDLANKTRSITMRPHEDAKRDSVDQVLQDHDIPTPLRSFLVTDAAQPRPPDARATMIRILEVVRDREIVTYSDFDSDDLPEMNKSTAANYLGSDSALEACVTKGEEAYELTTVGEQALNIPWDRVATELHG